MYQMWKNRFGLAVVFPNRTAKVDLAGAGRCTSSSTHQCANDDARRATQQADAGTDTGARNGAVGGRRATSRQHGRGQQYNCKRFHFCGSFWLPPSKKRYLKRKVPELNLNLAVWEGTAAAGLETPAPILCMTSQAPH
jgi:hypothetical protein